MAFNKKAFAITIIGVSTFLTVAGSTVGTLSWYAYSRSSVMSYTGTSVRKTGLLGIGIVDKDGYISSGTISKYSLEKDTINKIVWTTSSNGLNTEVIKEYLLNSPYSYNKLSPVSSHARAIDATSDLKLYQAPEHGRTTITEEATKKDYVVLPFAFRIFDENNEPMKNEKVWLTDATVETSGYNIDKAVRVHIKNDETQFIMRPADTSTTVGSNAVGGVLDLDGDGTYDYDNSLEEYFYGEYEEGYSVTHASSAYGIEDTTPQNVNGTPYTAEASTFLAKHHKNAKIANFDREHVSRAYYYPYGKVSPQMVDGSYVAGETGIPVSTTNNTTGIGYATLTIYIEGWDFAVVDKEIDHSFNLGLTFEINR